MDFDSDRITYSARNLLPSLTSDPLDPNSAPSNPDDPPLEPPSSSSSAPTTSLSAYTRHFREFLRNYRQNSSYIYRQQLSSRSRRNESFVTVDLSHLGEYDQSLASGIKTWPEVLMPCFEEGAREALDSLRVNFKRKRDENGQNGRDDHEVVGDEEDVDDENENDNLNGPDGQSSSRTRTIQVILTSTQTPLPLRSITSSHVNTLLKVPGIIISSARIRSKAMSIALRCTKCGSRHTVKISNPFGNAQIPQKCQGRRGHEADGQDCGLAPYAIIPDDCGYVDLQSLKLQEPPELVPTGEMPRNIVVSVERELVDRCKPGDRVMVVAVAGLMTLMGSNKQTSKKMYLRAFGMMKDGSGNGSHGSHLSFTPGEEQAFLALSRRPDVYKILCRSIAPSISGSYTVDIKKAIVCQLMGGSAKRLPDGMRLRGDINVLLLGDPSTAKSQFLKFVEKVAPVGVYTSGKGSSAAGLTASVIKDAKGEFYLEGGAMVLADGGVVCIDEFDKMRPQDRVAIHEAMEQQTISIAKAGITTVLNSRASVLAAANPIFGRYDDLRSAGENIDLMTTILSRFDLIFIVRDVREEERDKAIARHVMGIHVNSKSDSDNTGRNSAGGSGAQIGSEGGLLLDSKEGNSDPDGVGGTSAQDIEANASHVAANGGDLTIPTMKKFVQYCRSRCSPRLSQEAGEVLSSAYVKIRDDVRKRAEGDGGAGGDSSQAVPITVRQLEALVRLSESLAKMRLSAEVAAEDVAEALRLFKVSTMAASETDANNGSSDLMRGVKASDREDYVRAEAFVNSRVGVGTTVNRSRLIEEAVGVGWNAMVIARVVAVLCQKGDMVEKNSGRLVKRVR